LNAESKPRFLEKTKAEYADVREKFKNKKSAKQYLSFEEARKNKVKIDWASYTPPKPNFLGIKSFENYNLKEIEKFIDWGPFFIAWEMHGKFPAILTDKIVGKEATKLYEDATALLHTIIAEKWLTAKASIGIFPANSNGKETVIINDNGAEIRLESLRQQIKKVAGEPNICLADFIAPEESGKQDYIGAFAVTTGLGIEKWIECFEKDHDDYNKIMLKALADRLAEAFAECMHERVRKGFWGFASDERLSNVELIHEDYRGIRPAPGYPACPEHTEKRKLFKLIDATKKADIILTDHLAMYPASSVSGWYFSHPASHYFGIGKILADQVSDYAHRKEWTIQEAEQWLRPQLND
ncbi:MAG: vitamin B12 dependent-methionine synthase activation domain-containing protein, partial [Chitinophagaceae bacterium]